MSVNKLQTFDDFIIERFSEYETDKLKVISDKFLTLSKTTSEAKDFLLKEGYNCEIKIYALTIRPMFDDLGADIFFRFRFNDIVFEKDKKDLPDAIKNEIINQFKNIGAKSVTFTVPPQLRLRQSNEYELNVSALPI